MRYRKVPLGVLLPLFKRGSKYLGLEYCTHISHLEKDETGE